MTLRLGKCLLRSCRLAAGLTQSDLSDQLLVKLGLKVSSVTISHYENDRRPMTPTVMRGISIVLKCTEADLYEWLR